MGRQPPYPCTDWCRQWCSCVQASSSLYGALNASRGKLSTPWKSCPAGSTTVVTDLSRKRLKFSSVLETYHLLSGSYSQKWIFSKVKWHSRCLSEPLIEKADWGAYEKGNDKTIVRAPKHSQVLCKQYPDILWVLMIFGALLSVQECIQNTRYSLCTDLTLFPATSQTSTHFHRQYFQWALFSGWVYCLLKRVP